MKKFFFLLSFSFASSFLFAQSDYNTGFRLGGGITLAVPVNKLSGYSIGAGFDLLAQYALSTKIAVTGDIGYTTVFAKNKDLASFDIVPIRVGLRFFPASNFYVAGKIGTGIGVGKSSGSSTAYAVGVGFIMSPKLDVSASYEGFSKSGVSPAFLGIRLGYFFK